MKAFRSAHKGIHAVIRNFPTGTEIIFCGLLVPSLHKHLTPAFKTPCA
jgi:hypothetical protein